MAGLTFVLGGARSGKSRFAERLAASLGPRVLYVATLEPLDDEMRRRVAAHRTARPASWDTLEAPLRVVEELRGLAGYDAVLLDCLTLWVSNLLLAAPAGSDEDALREHVLRPVRQLLDWRRETDCPLIVVSNEVGAGIVPEYELGRAFRDLLGEANEALARAADRFYFLVAGHFLELKSLGARPVVPEAKTDGAAWL